MTCELPPHRKRRLERPLDANTFTAAARSSITDSGRGAQLVGRADPSPRFPGGTWPRWGALSLFLAAAPVSAQVALQNLWLYDAAADARTRQTEAAAPQDYTFKQGDFRLLVAPSLELEYCDNVNLADTGAVDDFVVVPAVALTASYPFTRRNLLYVDFSVGYDWYLKHPQFSSLQLNSSSGTALSLDLVVKDITINLHDGMSYAQGAGQNSFVLNTANGGVANTAEYGTFENNAGVAAIWDLNQVKLLLGYDHQNVLATSGQFDQINHSAEMVSFRTSFLVHPKIDFGIEATADFMAYSETLLNDNDAYTLGPYATFRPSQFFSVTVRGGYVRYEFDNTSHQLQTASQNGWYGSLTLTHQATAELSYALAAGHEVQPGIESDLQEDWYVRPGITWNLAKDYTLAALLFYEHGEVGVGTAGALAGTAHENFDWYGGDVKLQHALSPRLLLSLDYRLTLRTSSAPNDGYQQNLALIQLTYQFK